MPVMFVATSCIVVNLYRATMAISHHYILEAFSIFHIYVYLIIENRIPTHSLHNYFLSQEMEPAIDVPVSAAWGAVSNFCLFPIAGD